MTPEEETEMRRLLVAAIKELGEIAECIIKNDPRPDHWKAELCDLCGIAIEPMLVEAELEYYEACDIGVERKHQKIGEDE